MLSPEDADPTGGHLFRQFLFRPGRAVVRRPLPSRVFVRRPPSLLGLGALEALSVDAVAALADPEDGNGDGVSGRIPSGRFGWKARFPGLEEAVAAALVNELGLSNPVFPQDGGGVEQIEIGHTELRALTAFVRHLAPPTPRRSEPEGRAAFESFGCASCHIPSLPGLADRQGRVVEAFTDLLLHDMGPIGADVQEGDASPAEFRTSPLWGIGTTGPPYLHDGCAPSLDAAIRAHDGEGRAARSRYEEAPAPRRAALLRFLGSL